MKTLVAVALFVAAASSAAYACPCREGDLTFTDLEASGCDTEIAALARVRSYASSLREQTREITIQGYVDALKRCVLARRSEIKQAAEQEAAEKVAAAQAQKAAEARAQEAARQQSEAEGRQRAVAEAQARADEAQESADRASRQSVKIMRPIYSAAICQSLNVRRSAVDEIAKEKKYARVGGVISKTKLYALQQKMRAADESADANRRSLRAMKSSPLSCSTPAVRSFVSCFAHEGCEDDDQIHLSGLIEQQPPEPWSPEEE